ncbi:hypothetical protein TNCV_3317181 [Trichonephila clavipes]|nr:hypothetical protein TNCV_3317181 [Trichonephila clavipes]
MSKSKELSEFDRGCIEGCHLCRKSDTAEKRTGRPKILGERSRRTLKRVVKQSCKSSLVEISQEFQSSSGISVSSRTVRRERVKKTRDSMVVQPPTSQTTLHRMRSIDCSGVELTVIGLWTCGKLFFGVMNLAL